ncbi:MAG: thiamine-phosphate kinase [Armatimonadetes bacterium]|nr:thiamine-phosphate kinase [Armatimonadota bacterium]
MKSRPIRELGENAVVSRFRALASGTLGADVLVGPGDDAAVIAVSEERLLLLACDMMVEGTHFRWEWAKPRQVGWKAMVQNISDIAAMGGEPAAAVASIASPGDLPEEDAAALADGLVSAASRYGLSLVGGDLVGSPGPVVIDVAITGWVERDHLLLRRGASPGDALLVTGALGASAAGLAAREHGLTEADSSLLSEALSAHHEPYPRLAEARAIASTKRATAMMDLSDGLAEDLSRLCQSSGVGARVRAERVPIHRACSFVASRLGINDLQLSLTGGEDYQLLFTCPREAVDEIAKAVGDATGGSVSVIGEIVSEQEVAVLDADGRERPFGAGFDHFSSVAR